MPHDIEITFLGTAGHTPTAKKNHTGILLTYGAEMLLFDCGEGIQRQFKVARINPGKLTRILLTHWHGDHALGLGGLLYTLRNSEYNKNLSIYGPNGTKENLHLLEKVFHKIRLDYEITEVKQGIFLDEKEFCLEALPMEHGIAALAYSFTVKEKKRIKKSAIQKLGLSSGPHMKKLQQGKDIKHGSRTIRARDVTFTEPERKVAVIMDTSMNSNTVKIAKGADLLICESTFASDNKEKAREYRHLTAADAATIAKKANAKALVLTHISHRYEKDYSFVLNEAKAIFKNTALARDFDRIVL